MYAVTQQLMTILFILFSPLFMVASWADQRSSSKRENFVSRRSCSSRM